MNYRIASVGAIPSNASEEDLRYLLSLRIGVHGLKNEPARCLQAMSLVDPDSVLPQRCYLDFFSEELAEARRSPEFVRRALLEQTILSKRLVSTLMVRLSMADSAEAVSAYAAAIARLQGELRRNLRAIGELPLDENYVEPVKKSRSLDELVEQLLQPLDSDSVSETETHEEKIDVVTELVSKPTGRRETAAETEEPAPGRSRQPEPTITPRTHRYGPPESPGGSHEEQAVGMVHWPQDAAGQSPSRPKRATRQGHVAKIASAGIGSCHDVVDRNAETSAGVTDLCGVS